MISSVSASGAFFAGLLNFFASCLLPLVPLYLAHLGQAGATALTEDERRTRIRWGSIGFVLSFMAVFILLGAGLHGLVLFTLNYQRAIEIGGGILLLLLAVPLLPLQRYNPLHRELKFAPRSLNQPFVNGLLLGLVFAVAWSPCIGPVLGAVLTLAAAQSTYTEGVVLVTYYAAGLAAPFLLIAFAGEPVIRTLRPSKTWGMVFRWILIGAIVLEALLLITGRAGIIFSWLTQVIRIGSV